MPSEEAQDRQILGTLIARPHEFHSLDVRLLRGPSRLVAEIVREMQQRGVEVGLASVAATIAERNLTEDVGGLAWIATEFANPLSPAIAKHIVGYLSRRDIWRELGSLGDAMRNASDCLYGQEPSDLSSELESLRLRTETLCARGSGAEIDALPFGLISDDMGLAPIGTLDEHFHPHADGLLREGMVSILTAPSKAGKSYFAESMALHAASGENFIGFAFDRETPVLVVDWELRRLELIERFNRLADAYQIEMPKKIGYISMKEYQGDQDIISKRRAIEDACKRMGAKIIILDCLYMMKPDDADENSNSDMGAVVKTIDKLAVSTGAAVLVVHHQGKGDKSQTSTMDSGAGAGVVSRLVSCAVVAMKPHKEESCWSLFWSGRQIKEGAKVIRRVRFAYEVTGLDPNDVKVVGRNALTNKLQKSADMSEEAFVDEYCSGVLSMDSAVTAAIRGGVSKAAAERLFKSAVAQEMLTKIRPATRGCPAMYSADPSAEVEATPAEKVRLFIERNPGAGADQIHKETGVAKRTVYSVLSRGDNDATA